MNGRERRDSDSNLFFPSKISANAVTVWSLSPQKDDSASSKARNPKTAKFIAEFSDVSGREYMRASPNMNGEISFFVKLPKKEFKTQLPLHFPAPNDNVILRPIGDGSDLEYELTILSVEGNPGPRTKQVKITVVTNEIQ